MMSHPILWNTSTAVMRQDGPLPLTETVQRLVSMMVNVQVWLQKTHEIQHKIKQVYKQDQVMQNPIF